MDRLFSIFFWAFLAVTCVINFVIAFLLLCLTFWFDPDRRWNHAFSCWWGHLYAAVNPAWRVKVENRDRIDDEKACVLVANHSSMADIVLLYCLHKQFKWISKKVLFNVPFLGWNMRICRYIPLIRGDSASIKKMFGECHAWLERDMPILIFPEGTRSRDGTLRPFKKGAFQLALEADVPIVPIAIHGAFDLLPKTGWVFPLRTSEDLRVEVLEPVSQKDYDDPLTFGDDVRNQILTALGHPTRECASSPDEG